MGRVYNEIITSQIASGATKASFTTAASVLNAQARITIPANSIAVGDIFRIKVQAGISNLVTDQPTFTFQVQMGPTANIIAFTSGALLTTTTAHTLKPVDIEIILKADTIGSGTTAKFMGIGKIHGQMFITSGATADSVVTMPTFMLPVTAPAVGTGFNSTVDNLLDFFVACSVSDAGNAIAVYNYIVEKLSYQSSSLIQ